MDITEFKREDYLTYDEISKMLRVSRYAVTTYAMKGFIDNIIYVKKKAYVPILSLPKLKRILGIPEDIDLNNYITTQVVRKYLEDNGVKISIDAVRNWITSPTLNCQYFVKNLCKEILVHKDDQKKILEHLRTKPPKDYLTANEISNMYNLSLPLVKKAMTSKIMTGAKKISIKSKDLWVVPKRNAEKFLEKYEQGTTKNGTNFLKLKGFLTLQEIAERWNLNFSSIYNKLCEGQFPNAIFLHNKNLVPLEDIVALENQFNNHPQPYTKDVAVRTFEAEIDSTNVPSFLRETKRLFLEYGKITILKTRGREDRLKKVTTYNCLHTFHFLISRLHKEIYELSGNEIHFILENSADVAVSIQKSFVKFYNYSCYEKHTSPNKQYFISPEKKTDHDKEIYSPELYNNYFNHVKKIQEHIPKAIKSKYYVNMWLYTIMHLTDAWRGSDYIYELPHIDLESIGVYSLLWFTNCTLSREQCQIIINQVHIKVRHARASKTNAVLNFLVLPDLIECMATAMVISELHRRKKNDRLLLQTFMSGSVSKTTPNKTHLKFFELQPELSIFRSLTMNRTTLTYLYYSITEDGGKDSEIALEIARQTRSHKDANTTQLYVTVTNKDGSMNWVSLNLFKRGHFGWLYNYMIMMATSTLKINHTLEERTQIITALRKEYTPSEIEEWAIFLNRVRNNRQSVIHRLSRKTKEELVKLLHNIFTEKMPSRIEQGQCLTYPQCEHPKLKTCFSCENFIPKQLALIEAASEFKRLIKSIKEAKHEAVVRRDSEFIKHILLIFNQALEVFDEGYINAFIKMDEVNELLEEISAKLLLQ